MQIAVFSAKSYDREALSAADAGKAHRLSFFDAHLTVQTVQLAQGAAAVCAFVNDDLRAPVIERLAALGVRLIVLRSAGFNHVDLAAAD